MGLNQHRILSGDIESIRFYSQLIVQRLNGRLAREGNGDFLKVFDYDIDILGNPASRKSVRMKIIEDIRNNTGEIKVEHGSEYIDWLMSIGRICDCCSYNVSKSFIYVVCYKFAEPTEAIQTGFCNWYKFNEKKYRSYLERKK